MQTRDTLDVADDLYDRIQQLTPAQRERVAGIVDAIAKPSTTWVNTDSDFMTAELADILGETLRIHHTMSTESYTKDKFEHGLQAALEAVGHDAELAPKGNPGHDLTVDGVRWSLKTQANKGIDPKTIHISKFMELGKGVWATEADLAGLRDRMFAHMTSYDRILTLRCLTPGRTDITVYELVEIPKALLQASERFPCTMMVTSKQTPKPGVCRVLDAQRVPVLELYFDGGTERKLQIRKLRKDMCVVHATWEFQV